MNRLTYKLDECIKTKFLNYEYGRIKDHDIMRGNLGRITDDMIFNKLGQLEDIEEELGIDLIILFKALKNGFYHIDENKHIYKMKPTKGNGGAMNFYACLDSIIAEDTFGDQYIYSLKDYGKVWALTKRELEQNE